MLQISKSYIFSEIPESFPDLENKGLFPSSLIYCDIVLTLKQKIVTNNRKTEKMQHGVLEFLINISKKLI